MSGASAEAVKPYKPTAKEVKCAACARCSTNSWRACGDAGACCVCYMRRLEASGDLLRAKMDAIWAAGNYYFDKAVFFDPDADFILSLKKRLSVMREWRRTVQSILGASDMDKVKAEKKRFDELYFGKSKEGV